MLVGREKEVEFLLQVLEKPNPQLIAVYGRRRIGKTFLIRETYGQMFSFQHAGVYSGTLTSYDF